MENDRKIAANRMYETLKKVTGELVQNFDTTDDDRIVEFIVSDEPFPIQLKAVVIEESGVLNLYSSLQFDVPEDKRLTYAATVCDINYDKMYVGNFDFSPASGKTVFRLSLPFSDSLISDELVRSAIVSAYQSVKEHNETLFKASRNEN